MRRTDREKDAAFALEVLRDAEYVTLATVNADGTPYCVPVSHVLVGGLIYFHGAAEGKKLGNVKERSGVCLTAVRNVQCLPEKFTTEYESAVAVGICELVDDEPEKIMALKKLCEKYAPAHSDKVDAMLEKTLHRTCVCRVQINEITGKANM
jgi:hypothetical protein